MTEIEREVMSSDDLSLYWSNITAVSVPGEIVFTARQECTHIHTGGHRYREQKKRREMREVCQKEKLVK